MPKLSERGAIQFVIPLILLAGIVLGVYLVQQRTNIFSKAAYVSSPLIPSPFSYSFYLNLVTDDNRNQYIKAPNTSAQNSSANFTAEAWIRPDPSTVAVNNQDVYSIVGKTKSIFGNDAYGLWLLMTPQSNGSVKYNYQFRVTTGAWSRITADSNNGTVNDDNGVPINGATVSENEFKTWRHVAGVISNGNLYIYENGKLVAKNEYGMTNFGASTAPLEIGARLLSDNTHDSYFKGEIDEVRVSNIARYTTNFSVPIAPFLSDSDTIAMYHLDGNFLDSSSNRNNAEGVAGIGNGSRSRNFVFVNSAAGIIPTPVPSSTPTPAPAGGPVIDIPGPIDIPIPPIFLPPTPAPTPLPLPTPAPEVCPSGSSPQCLGYITNNNNANCYRPDKSFAGEICHPGCGGCGVLSLSTPTPAPVTTHQGCADSAGNGPNSSTCTGYVGQDTSLCPNNVYPYLYSTCTGGQSPTSPVGGQDCADSDGNGANGLRCTGYIRSDQNLCPSNVYPYLYSSCSR